MQKFDSFQEFADRLKVVQRKNVPAMFKTVLRIVGSEAAETAREKLIGRITPLKAVGPFVAWAPLAASTIERKDRKGWGKGGDPRTMLYATGRLYASVKYHVHMGQLRVSIVSDTPYGGYLERGTGRMPPRPFLGPALFLASEHNYRNMERWLTRSLRGQRL